MISCRLIANRSPLSITMFAGDQVARTCSAVARVTWGNVESSRRFDFVLVGT
jgi:hypothetical protein